MNFKSFKSTIKYISTLIIVTFMIIAIAAGITIAIVSINDFIRYHNFDQPKIEEFIDLRMISMNGMGTVYYDKNTGVMYYRDGDISFPILNQDGTPKLYLGDE